MFTSNQKRATQSGTIRQSDESQTSQNALEQVPISEIANKRRVNFFLDPATQNRISVFTEFNDMMAQGCSTLTLNRLSQIMIKTTSSPEETHALFLFLQRRGWAILQDWANMVLNASMCSGISVGDHVYNILRAIICMITTAQNQSVKTGKDKEQALRQPLGDIFENSRQSLLTVHSSSQPNLMSILKPDSQKGPEFNKRQLIDLCRNPQLPVILKTLCLALQNSHSFIQKQCLKQIFKITKTVAVNVMNICQKGDIYEKTSQQFLRSGIFIEMFANVKELMHETDLEDLIRTLEFCSVSNDGLEIINQRIEETIQIIDMCFQRNRQEESVLLIPDIDVLYPAATVLLDLTANEDMIAKCSQQMYTRDMFSFIVKIQIPMLLKIDIRQTQLKKLRDLFIGMVLNLTCNIEDNDFIIYLVKDMNVLSPLLQILMDPRQDWPTHGAAQALMQYSQQTFQNPTILRMFEKNKISQQIQEIRVMIEHPEAQQHLDQCLVYLDISRSKQSHLKQILKQNTCAMAA